jgi:hypothetical protein
MSVQFRGPALSCKAFPFAAATLAVLPLLAAAAEPRAEDTALTIYSSALPGAIPAEYYRPLPGTGTPSAMDVPGYALVRHERTLTIPAGRSQLRFTDVAALIDPTTVTFTSLSDAGTRVLEQNFQFDLVSTDKLLQKYIDRPLTVERSSGGQSVSTTGTLLSAADGLVLRSADGSLNAVRDYQSIRFQELPGGLITRPTLLWEVASAKAGDQRARVSYQSGGITWWSDYNLIFSPGADANNGFVDLAAWVSVINQSGASYPEARLKLIAGEVNRAQPAAPPRLMMARAMDGMEKDSGGFVEQSFDEFHLYTLGRRTSLPNNSTKQIELFDQARRVPAQRQLVFAATPGLFGSGEPLLDRGYGLGQPAKVQTFLQFRNDRASGLGLPLPAGRIRVSRLDKADGSLEFIGEDVIGHTPRDERVRVRLGSAFDVVGERTQRDFTVDSRGKVMEEEITVELRNHKDEAVEVQVREGLYRWARWQVLSSSLPYEKTDARTIVFAAKIPKLGTSTVRYRVRYQW